MGKLEGRTAVVTGGASGIGQAICELFAEEGAEIGIFDLTGNKAEDLASLLRTKYKRNMAFYHGDVSKLESVSEGFDQLKNSFGHIDILVNCAGIDNTVYLEDMELSVWNRMLEVHLTGTFLCTKQVLTSMRTAHWGRIINFSSQLAHKGAPSMVHYCTAKAGIIGFTRALAYELGDSGVTVNCINPGPVETPLLQALPETWLQNKKSEIPLKRFGQVSEVAPTAVLLASDGGGYYMGASMNMNGGDYMI
tara:strand:- start:2168 stop:2917 length:750 start_codon:yes stop_codon:yes gene_type:complete